nr:hypothetical protein [Tanacetum cinerariifolium]
MTKVNIDVMRPWIAHRLTELGFEDEVLINFIYGLLEGKENASGVPQQFLDAKGEETRKKQEDRDCITRELKRAKEKEGRELDQERTRRTRDREDHGYDHERVKVDREVDNMKAATLEPHSRRQTRFSSKWKVTDEKNGSRSPLRRRSRSPIQRRSRSPIRRRSRSPIRQRSRSPICRKSQSPIGRRSRSLIRRTACSPIRRRLRSPSWRRSPFRRRSPSPFRRRSPSPYRHRSQSPVSPSQKVSLSPSPVRRRRKITNPGQQRSPSPGSMSFSPSGRISLSPKRNTPPSMLRRGSPKRQQRSPSESPRDGYGVTQRNAPDRQMPRKETAERLTESCKASNFSRNLPPPPPLPKGQRVPALSPSPYNSPPESVSPPAARRTPSKERSPIPRKRQRETMNSKDRVDRVGLEEKAFSRPRKERRGNKNSVNDKYDSSKYSPEKLTSHLPTGTQAQKRTSTNDEGKRKYSELAHEPLCSRKDILSSKRERVPEKGYKFNEINQEAVKLTKALPTVKSQTRSGSFDFGSQESDHKKKRKRSKRKDVTSNDDDSHDSHIEDRKEAKRRRKEERKLKKEEKRRRREERRYKKDSRRTAKLKLKAGGDVSPSSDLDKSHDSREEAFSDPKKLEIELWEKAFESLRAKKGFGY